MKKSQIPLETFHGTFSTRTMRKTWNVPILRIPMLPMKLNRRANKIQLFCDECVLIKPWKAVWLWETPKWLVNGWSFPTRGSERATIPCWLKDIIMMYVQHIFGPKEFDVKYPRIAF